MTANRIVVEMAHADDFQMVGTLVNRLLVELFPDEDDYRDSDKHVFAAKQLLAAGDKVWALLAKTQGGEIVGLLTLNECAAIYAGGNFGEISELYVDGTQRSCGVGARLIEAARAFAVSKGWPEIEVGAPPQPEWKRTFDFYQSQGFVYSGPRLYLPVD